MDKPKPKPSPKKRRWLKGFLAFGVLVVVPQLFFQLHVVEGPSMWPMFNDGVDEEWVLSVRSWVDRQPKVYDVIVVDDPENASRQVVKRVVALPGDYPVIYDGDLRVRSLGHDSEWYLRRDLGQIQSTRVNMMSLPKLRRKTRGADFDLVNDLRVCVVPLQGSCSLSDEGRHFKLEPREDVCELRLPQENFLDDHKTSAGGIGPGDNLVRDLMITFTWFELSSAKVGATFEIQHWNRESATPAATLIATVTRKGLHLRSTTADDQAFETTIEKRDRLAIRFLLVDDVQAILSRNEDEEGPFELIHRRPRASSARPAKSFIKLLARGGSVILSRLDIDRDIHYTPATDRVQPDGKAHPISDSPSQRGQYFLLGDNSPQSRDSRHWRVPEPHHVVGRPIMVVWPWSRMRVLP